MATLLLRLAGPLQSWGSSIRFNKRMTEREPTKSGVVGMVAAALGRRRDQDLSDLRALCFGTRIDQPGQLLQDFHTAHTSDAKQAFVSHRYYLADAVFVVGLEGDIALLQTLADALRSPFFPLCLCRRSCPPSGQIVLGIQEGLGLSQAMALGNTAWQPSSWYRRSIQQKRQEAVRDGRPFSLEIESVYESCAKSGATGANVSSVHTTSIQTYTQRDVPLSFDQEYRQYGFREVYRSREPLVFADDPVAVSDSDKEAGLREELPADGLQGETATSHDPLQELEVI